MKLPRWNRVRPRFGGREIPWFSSRPPGRRSRPIRPKYTRSCESPTCSNIPIELIAPNPNQPRRHFSDAELNELADSIKTHGVLQPILVRPAKAQAGRYEIVAGERRWRAARRASVHALPAVVRELDEVEVLEIGIIENVQRADLNPLEEAQGYQTLISQFGRTQQDIADVVGKSRPYIANLIRLLTLPRRNQKAQLPAHQRAFVNGIRQIIETVNHQLSELFQIEINHAHTFWGLCTRLYSKLTAHTLCIYINRLLGKPDFLQIK